MSAEIELWSLELPGGSEEEIVPATHIRLTNISFGEDLAEASGRSVIKLLYKAITGDDEDEGEEDDEEQQERAPTTTILTALTAGKVEHSTLNIVLLEDRNYVLSNTGKNTVYLTGNYIETNDEPPYEDESDLSDEEGYNLQDVSSDVEMNPEDLAGLGSDSSRFEEIKDEAAPKPTKRPRDVDAEKLEPTKEKKNKKLKGEGGKPIPTTDEAPKDRKAPSAEKTKALKELAGGLKILDVKVGEGAEAKKGSRVGMRYIGKLENGTIFDKNIKGKPFYFKVGKGEVIKGWDEGIPGMRIGGERILTVPASLAYGNKKTTGIPANSTLKFEVKLLEVK